MTKIQKIVIFFFIFYFLFFIFDISSTHGKTIDLYFFWGSGCPHCAVMDGVLKEISASNPDLNVRNFETWYNPDNQILLKSLAEGYNFSVRGVPVIFIGNTVIEGAGQAEINKLKLAVENCSKNDCPSPKDKIKTAKSHLVLNWSNIGIFFGVVVSIFLLVNLLKKKKSNGD